MKKTMKTLLALMAGVMTFSACSNEDVLTNETPNVTPEVKGIRSFTAFTESNPATRATIDGLSVKWQSGDAILVMGDNIEKYNLSAGEGTTSGTFDADESGVYGSDIYAVYPYEFTFESITDEEAYDYAINVLEVSETDWNKYLGGTLRNGNTKDMLDNDEFIQTYKEGGMQEVPAYSVSGTDIIGVSLPSIQNIYAGQVVAPKAVVMAAKADGENNLAFKNVCSYIKVTPTVELDKIEVSANNGEYLSGNFTIDMSDPENPAVKSVTSRLDEVTFQALGGNLAPGTYYIAVLPGTLAGGLSIKFYTTETEYTESSISTPFTFERNKVYNGGSQPAASTPTTGTAAATGIGNVGWVQLWENGPKFADRNVGANSSTDAGTEMTFTEAIADPFTWGSNWCTPSYDDLDHLIKAAADEDDDKVKCEYTQEGGVYGFKFTGLTAGYTDNSVFFPIQDGNSSCGHALYWSSTADDSEYSEAWSMDLLYDNGDWHSGWRSDDQYDDRLVRPVLKEN